MTEPFEHQNPRTHIVAGAGSIQRLPELLDQRGVRRALVVCGRTVFEGPQLVAVRAAAGDHIAGVFADVRAHSELQGLLAGVRAVEAAGADCLITVGGGAAIDTAKCIALLRACGDEPLEDFCISEQNGRTVRGRPVPPTMPHVAIPTTAGSGSEVMPSAGIRDKQRRVKLLFSDDELTPQVAVLDPQVLADTSPWLTATSGVTSLARSIETLYSNARQPVSEALAVGSLRLMVPALPAAVRDGYDLPARLDSLIAAGMSGIAATNSMVSLVHAVGHAVGGLLALQHGLSHAVLLPHAARIYLPTLPTYLLRQTTEALGVDPTGLGDAACVEQSVDALAALLAELPIGTRLRDVGVPEDAIDYLVEQTMHDPMFGFVPIPTDRTAVRDVLTAAW